MSDPKKLTYRKFDTLDNCVVFFEDFLTSKYFQISYDFLKHSSLIKITDM